MTLVCTDCQDLVHKTVIAEESVEDDTVEVASLSQSKRKRSSQTTYDERSEERAKGFEPSTYSLGSNVRGKRFGLFSSVVLSILTVSTPFAIVSI